MFAPQPSWKKTTPMPENVQSFHGPISERVRASTVAHCQNMTGRLLDVGCGNGLLFDALATRTSLVCTGVDRSVELLHAARHRQPQTGCVKGLLNLLPFQNRSFNVVTCLNTLLNLATIDTVAIALNEMMRISAGQVIVDIRNADNPYMRLKYRLHRRTAGFQTVAYHLSEIQNVFQNGGFSVERVYPVGMDNRWFAWGYLVAGARGKLNKEV